jgi:Cu+-exporting ATPase
VSELETIRFPVAGMTCASCVNRITRSLKKVDGVSKVRVDLGGETATVARDPGLASDSALAAAIAAAGYEADLAAAVVLPPAEPRGLLARLKWRTR